jgi:hypothetical protein
MPQSTAGASTFQLGGRWPACRCPGLTAVWALAPARAQQAKPAGAFGSFGATPAFGAASTVSSLSLRGAPAPRRALLEEQARRAPHSPAILRPAEQSPSQASPPSAAARLRRGPRRPLRRRRQPLAIRRRSAGVRRRRQPLAVRRRCAGVRGRPRQRARLWPAADHRLWRRAGQLLALWSLVRSARPACGLWRRRRPQPLWRWRRLWRRQQPGRVWRAELPRFWGGRACRLWGAAARCLWAGGLCPGRPAAAGAAAGAAAAQSRHQVRALRPLHARVPGRLLPWHRAGASAPRLWLLPQQGPPSKLPPLGSSPPPPPLPRACRVARFAKAQDKTDTSTSAPSFFMSITGMPEYLGTGEPPPSSPPLPTCCCAAATTGPCSASLPCTRRPLGWTSQARKGPHAAPPPPPCRQVV